jgi:hypothetical protein
MQGVALVRKEGLARQAVGHCLIGSLFHWGADAARVGGEMAVGLAMLGAKVAGTVVGVVSIAGGKTGRNNGPV